jgi:Uma2 family endonuclease
MKTHIEPLLTVDDLDALPDDGNRYELIGGGLYVSRAPSVRHQLVLQKVQFALGRYLEQNPIGMLIPGPGVIFDQYNAVIPDLVFVLRERCAEVVSDHVSGAPDIAVEVVSPGSTNEQRDRKIKRRLYGERGVREYWIVDPENLSIEVYHLGDAGLELFAALTADNELTSPVLPGFQLRVASVFEV